MLKSQRLMILTATELSFDGSLKSSLKGNDGGSKTAFYAIVVKGLGYFTVIFQHRAKSESDRGFPNASNLSRWFKNRPNMYQANLSKLPQLFITGRLKS